MILSHDRERGRVSLSTKKLEPTPGDMIRNPKLVFEKVTLIQTFHHYYFLYALCSENLIGTGFLTYSGSIRRMRWLRYLGRG